MVLSKWLAGSSCVLAFVAMVGPARSVPLASAAGFMKSADITAGSPSEQVAYRVCGMQGGVTRCRWVGPGVYGYQAPGAAPLPVAPPAFYGYGSDYRPTDPDDYPTGSPGWWRSMDRWDRGGRPN